MSLSTITRKSCESILGYGCLAAVIFIFLNEKLLNLFNLSSIQFLAIDFIFAIFMLSFFVRRVELHAALVKETDDPSWLTQIKQGLYRYGKPRWLLLIILPLIIILPGALFIKYIPLAFGHTITTFIMGGCLLGLGISLWLYSCYHLYIKKS